MGKPPAFAGSSGQDRAIRVWFCLVWSEGDPGRSVRGGRVGSWAARAPFPRRRQVCANSGTHSGTHAGPGILRPARSPVAPFPGSCPRAPPFAVGGVEEFRCPAAHL
ncbi:hypothetical protein GCM10012285_17990 [Streptomyces kronopolitis]|uniref:Uncharacterized protein n=1 Tax=Streptomyces kronopolitis TaxID=1612435 RepID=A0ABQ2J4U6_9ACTN|nr:hypothetical protein GCM10012285_17990 [Streptomyces kronopolitis]